MIAQVVCDRGHELEGASAGQCIKRLASQRVLVWTFGEVRANKIAGLGRHLQWESVPPLLQEGAALILNGDRTNALHGLGEGMGKFEHPALPGCLECSPF